MNSRYSLFGLALMLAAGPAYATPDEIQATAAFAIPRDPSGQKAAAVASALLHRKLSGRRGIRRVEPVRVLTGDPRTREEETLERARAALADGRRAYDALNLDDAIARVGQAVSLYQQTGPLLGELSELVTALAYLGSALVLRGSADEGESTFAELLTIDPGYQLPEPPPQIEEVFNRAAAKVEAMPSGSVELYSTPPYAAVFVDGRFEGVTPVTLTDLIAGTHYIRVEKLGYTVHGGPLDISANQQITNQTMLRSIKGGAELRDLSSRAADEVLEEGMGGALRQLSRQMVADQLIIISVSQSGRDATFTAGIFDGKENARLATERVVLSVDDESFRKDLGRFVDRALAASRGGSGSGSLVGTGGSGDGSGAFGLKRRGGGKAQSGNLDRLVGRQRPNKTPGEVYLGWTLVGLGGAAIVTGIVFGVLAQDVHSDFRLTPQRSVDLPDLQDLGKRNALIADLCYLGGTASVLVGSAILLVTAMSNPSPEELIRGNVGFAPTEDGGLITYGGQF